MDLRAAATRVLCDTPAIKLLGPHTAGRAAIFLLHRMAVPALGNAGEHDAARLEALLGWVRERGLDVAPIDDVVARLHGIGRPLHHTVSFTADDGYLDQAVMAEIFVRFEVPLTIFVMTGFVDRKLLPWWDRLALAIRNLPTGVAVDLPTGRATITEASSEALVGRTTAWAKSVHPSVRDRAIDALGALAGEPPPTTPEHPYLPLDWDDARRLAATGFVTFGAHTVSHPILARLTDEESKAEIEGSRARLHDELGSGRSNVFCYPNGEGGDYTSRDVRLVRDAGFDGAVGVRFQVASRDDDRWAVPRMPLPDDLDRARRAAAGAVRYGRMGTPHR